MDNLTFYRRVECLLCLSDPSIQSFNSLSKPFDNLANAPHLIEFVLELVDLSQDFVEACYFGVGHFDCISGAVVLNLGRSLGLLV